MIMTWARRDLRRRPRAGGPGAPVADSLAEAVELIDSL